MQLDWDTELMHSFYRAAIGLVAIAAAGNAAGQTQDPASDALPVLRLPDPKIEEVYRGNWSNTLLPCRTLPPPPATDTNVHADPRRPWKVDVNGHYPGWYPGVDVKHMAAAYLACEKNLPLVLRAWELTSQHYLMSDGGVRPMTMSHNPHNIVPEATVDGRVVYYPLRMTANIDFLLLGDMIYRFSQDRRWLAESLPAMRRAATFIEGWIDDEGLLLSHSYDLDQVYREIDGVAQASAILAFRKLSELEGVLEDESGQKHAGAAAARLAAAAEKHFWDPKRGYYVEHLVYNNVARSGELGSIQGASSELNLEYVAANAIDGVIGIGIDAFNVGTGAAGRHEWAAKGETVGAWIQVALEQSTRIGSVILLNRTDPQIKPGERFAAGYLEFSDGSPRVPVAFNSLDISRSVVSFEPRDVTWVRFTGTRMRGQGGENAGLAEFLVMPAEQPYRKISHGMTDTSLAMVAFGIAQESRAASVWRHFKANELAFYEVNGLHAPTWIAEKAETYGDSDLNRRAPYKDCVAMARTWRYDALMRHRMDDGEGLHRTITYANALYDRPSGGGKGLFAERYGLGRFQPGDEAQATVAAYSGYPAIYNSFIVQQTLLGIDVDVSGTIHINPCVPRDWYRTGFGQEGCGVTKDCDIGFTYHSSGLDGWISGPAGQRSFRFRLPPEIADKPCSVLVNEQEIKHAQNDGFVTFTVELPGGAKTSFTVKYAGA